MSSHTYHSSGDTCPPSPFLHSSISTLLRQLLLYSSSALPRHVCAHKILYLIHCSCDVNSELIVFLFPRQQTAVELLWPSSQMPPNLIHHMHMIMCTGGSQIPSDLIHHMHMILTVMCCHVMIFFVTYTRSSQMPLINLIHHMHMILTVMCCHVMNFLSRALMVLRCPWSISYITWTWLLTVIVICITSWHIHVTCCQGIVGQFQV